MVTVTNLRCEYRANPLGLDIVPPRLSWQLQSDRRGARQTAYRIIAAADKRAARNEQSILWDSGKTKSDQSIHIPYAGEPLASGQRVWWKVRVWDEYDQPTAYSALAWWEMGLLNRDDWQGQWIGASLVGGKYTTIPCPFLRREVESNGLPGERWGTNLPSSMPNFIEAQVWNQEPLQEYKRQLSV